VTLDHIDRAHAELASSPRILTLERASLHEQLVAAAVAVQGCSGSGWVAVGSIEQIKAVRMSLEWVAVDNYWLRYGMFNKRWRWQWQWLGGGGCGGAGVEWQWLGGSGLDRADQRGQNEPRMGGSGCVLAEIWDV
jgi:hypothetical protein